MLNIHQLIHGNPGTRHSADPLFKYIPLKYHPAALSRSHSRNFPGRFTVCSNFDHARGESFS